MGNKDRYYWLKEHGICVQCGQQDAAPNRVMCLDCLQKNSLNALKRYYNKKRKNPDYLAKENKKRAERRLNHKNNGICIDCTQKATHGLYCYEHFIYRKRKGKERANKKRNERHDRGLIPEYRINNGLCYYCGNPIEDYLKKTGCKVCAACRERCSENAKLRNQNHPWIKENKIVFSKGGNK